MAAVCSCYFAYLVSLSSVHSLWFKKAVLALHLHDLILSRGVTGRAILVGANTLCFATSMIEFCWPCRWMLVMQITDFKLRIIWCVLQAVSVPCLNESATHLWRTRFLLV